MLYATGQNIRKIFLAWLLLCPVLFLSCGQNNNAERVVSKLDDGPSCIQFSNTITVNDCVNRVVERDSCMGSGVGVGHFNIHAPAELAGAASEARCRLYLNLGNHQLRDMTSTV